MGVNGKQFLLYSPGEAKAFMLHRIMDLLSQMSARPKDDKIDIGLLPVTFEKLTGTVTEDMWARFEINLMNPTLTMQSRTFTEPFALMEKVETSARHLAAETTDIIVKRRHPETADCPDVPKISSYRGFASPILHMRRCNPAVNGRQTL
ncbi:hypothetical protein SprV_0602094600 [Sparganum proliferum]